MEKMENPELPKGEFTITLMSADPVPGPFTGIEYWTPAGSYHCAFVMASSTRLAPKRAFTEVNVFLLV